MILQPWFAYYGGDIPDAILLACEICNQRQSSTSTEKAHTHRLRRYGLFLERRGWLVTVSPGHLHDHFPSRTMHWPAARRT